MSDSGSAASLFRPGDNCCAVARSDRVAFLVDGEAYFETFMRAAERAERSIVILAWDLDSRTRLSFNANASVPTTLGDFLNYLVQRRRQLHVHVLDWDYPMVFGTDRELSPLYGFNWKPHRRVHFRYDNTHPLAGSHHQKIVVIDDKLAFVGGFDLTCKRWDTPEHRPRDPRRVAQDQPYPPFHDLMIALDGEAARVLAGIARKRWKCATGETLVPIEVSGDPWPDSLAVELRDVDAGIACTSPAVNGERGERDVEQLYLDMIARAKRTIYIENQYFTSHTIGEALAARLREPDGPEIVLVTRLLSHGWLEEMTMHVLRTRLIRKLRAADHGRRFNVYYPHVPGLKEGTCIDTHSKAMAVDDEWLRIGSANLSNRSMGLDTECDVVIEARGDARVAATIRGFRDRLIAEHLDVAPSACAREIERTGSMSGAIAALKTDRRTLRPLDDLPQWPDALINAIAITDPERPVSLESLIYQFAPDTSKSSHSFGWKKILAVAAVLLGLVLAWRYTPLAELVTAENATVWARKLAGYWWAPFMILLAYTPASVVLFPRPLITLAAVVAFGPWLGFIYAMSGILLAAVASYFAGRMLNRDTVRRIAGEKLNRLSNALRKRGLLACTAIRLVPLAPFVVIGLVAGAIRIKLWHFTLGTFFGTLPGVLVATVFGGQLEAVLRDSSSINYWLIGGAVLALVIAMVVVRKWFMKIEADEAGLSADGPRRAGA